MPHYSYPVRTPGSRISGRLRRARDASQVPGNLEVAPLPTMSNNALYGTVKNLSLGWGAANGYTYGVVSPETTITVSATGMTIDLPSAGDYANTAIRIKSRNHAVLVNAPVTIDDVVADFLIQPWGAGTFYSDGSNWFIENIYVPYFVIATDIAAYTVPVKYLNGRVELTKGSAQWVTLPDPSATNTGSRIQVVSTTDFTHIVSSFTNDKLTVLNNLSADRVQCDQAGEKIGAVVEAESNGTYWIIRPISGTWTAIDT